MKTYDVTLPVNDFAAKCTLVVDGEPIKSLKKVKNMPMHLRFARWMLWKIYNACCFVKKHREAFVNAAVVIGVVAITITALITCTALFEALGTFEHGYSSTRHLTAAFQSSMFVAVVYICGIVFKDICRDLKEGFFFDEEYDDYEE